MSHIFFFLPSSFLIFSVLFSMASLCPQELLTKITNDSQIRFMPVIIRVRIKLGFQLHVTLCS